MLPIFANAREAVAWAEELASRPVCDTLLGKNMIKSGSGGLSPVELRDVAFTISNLVANYDKPKGVLFRVVYGHPNGDGMMSVMDYVAHDIHRTPAGEKVDIAKLRGLVGGIIASIREAEVYDRRLSRSRIAKHIGITRQSFNEGPWPELESIVRAKLSQWLDAAEGNINNELNERGWLS